MTKILAVETSTDACSVALLVNDNVIEHYQLAARKHTQLILPMLQSLLTKANLQLSQLNAIAFGCGPGSFTGVRIAASLTQGLAFGANLSVAPISSLKALAQRAFEDLRVEKVLVAFDACMQEVYWGVYQLNKNGLMDAVMGDSLCRPENIPLPKDGNWIGVGGAWDIYGTILKERLGDKLSDIKAQLYPRAREVAKLGYSDYLSGKAVCADKALPKYLRSML